jgi:hypothetical protein
VVTREELILKEKRRTLWVSTEERTVEHHAPTPTATTATALVTESEAEVLGAWASMSSADD